MDDLTAFEFIAAGDGPQLVRLLTKSGELLFQFGFVGWLGVDLSAHPIAVRREDLVIEGQGLGHPYWNGEATPWSPVFDPESEHRRIEAIRAAVQREVNRAALSVM